MFDLLFDIVVFVFLLIATTFCFGLLTWIALDILDDFDDELADILKNKLRLVLRKLFKINAKSKEYDHEGLYQRKNDSRGYLHD